MKRFELLRYNPVLRALSQSSGVLLVHKLLRAMGLPILLGPELWQMARVRGTQRVPASVPGSKKRVLFFVPRNWSTHAVFQVALAQALTLRGAECTVATCGGRVPLCEVTWAERERVPRCRQCKTYVEDLSRMAGVRVYMLADYTDPLFERTILSEIEPLTIDELVDYRAGDLPLGTYAMWAARWRLRAYHIEQHPDGRAVLAGLVRSAALWAASTSKLLEALDPHVVVMLNGLFLEEQVACGLARRQGRQTVLFERGRDAGTVFLSHDKAAAKYDISASWERVREKPLTSAERTEILNVMSRRVRGEQMIETYWETKQTDIEAISRRLGLDRQHSTAVLYTNVVWDTSMQDRDVIFDGMFQWLGETIELFRRHPDWLLTIRIHPAEAQVAGRESFERTGDWIRDRYGTLPSNIRVIHPQDPIDSYALMKLARLGLVYASTTGLELAVSGLPVVVAGAAHYAGKGFTYDPRTKEEYAVQIEKLMSEDSEGRREQRVELALRYAHLFFLRRTFPMTVVIEPSYARPRLAYSSLDELLPGRHRALDMMCEGILNGREFELP